MQTHTPQGNRVLPPPEGGGLPRFRDSFMAFLRIAALGVSVFLNSCALFQGSDDANEVIIKDEAIAKRKRGSWSQETVSNIESIYASHGKKISLSESYLYYRYFEFQLSNPNKTLLSMSSDYQKSLDVILKYGLMEDKDFLPQASPADALKSLNGSLSGGALKKSRDSKSIRAALNLAFGVNFSPEKSKVIRPARIKFDGLTLEQELKKQKALAKAKSDIF
jgi:hypothetical protein